MDPKISNISFEEDVYKFTLSDINVSLANAIRRTVLSDIPINAIHTETYQDNQCTIHTNTSRLHNEILKHRLSSIPIHMTDLDILPDNYVLELDVENNTDNMIIVTTEDFRIRNKNSDKYLTKDETRRIFPSNPKTNMFIDFTRLRPSIGNSIPGEKIKLTAEFSVKKASENSMFNVVSKISYGNTIDLVKAKENWDIKENKLLSESESKTDIEVKRKNYYLLDAQRQYKENSFDFVVQSIGIYENKEIIKKACEILVKKFTNLINMIDSGLIVVKPSETTMDNCYDIILENEDYTLGKVLEFILYENEYVKDQQLSFCGFKKFHPHDEDSTIRVAFNKPGDKDKVYKIYRSACVNAGNIFTTIYKMF